MFKKEKEVVVNDVDSQAEKKREKIEKVRKTRRIVLLSGTIALVVSLILNVVFVMALANKEERIEGSGYNAAKNAVTEYVKAFKKGDIDKMLSATAIESFLSNLNFEEKLVADGSYSYEGYIFPYKNDKLQKELSTEMYKEYHLRQILNKYLYLGGDLETSRGVDLQTGGLAVADKLVKTLVDDEFSEKLKKMKTGKKIVASELKELVADDITDEKERISKFLNCDDFTTYAVEITFCDTDYYMFVDAVSINGKWYVLSSSSHLAILAGTDAVSYMKIR